MKYTVPATDGECLFDPPREEVPQLIESNHSPLQNCDCSVAEASFRDLRSAARRRIAERAARTASEGLRIVVAAHQPGFPGPGILYKHRVLQELSVRNLSVNFVADSDVCRGLSVSIPCRRGRGIGLKEVIIVAGGRPVVFEKLRLPPKREVDLCYDEIEGLLGPPGFQEMLFSFRDFRVVHDKVYREGDSAAKVLTAYRGGYYPTPAVLEHSISEISHSEEFLLFGRDIIENIEKFHEAYNSALEEHRRLHGIRNPAIPFPKLKREGNVRELPFWAVDALHRRRRLFARCEGAKRSVFLDGKASEGLPPEPVVLDSLRIRPRAACLTMFLRLFVADVFVHGVGGGNYDQATDRIIQAYYGILPPAYLVCSRTKFPSNDRSAVLDAKAAQLREKLRQMEQNPEKFVRPGDPIREEALRILSNSASRPSARQHVRVREIRRTLAERIGHDIALARNEIAEVEDILRREAALHRRDFPYFLYSRLEL
jgi:hypothetical protein